MVCIDWFGFFYVECIVGRDDTNVTTDPVQYEVCNHKSRQIIMKGKSICTEQIKRLYVYNNNH